MYGGGVGRCPRHCVYAQKKVCMDSAEYACLYEVRKKGQRGLGENCEGAVVCRFTRA